MLKIIFKRSVSKGITALLCLCMTAFLMGGCKSTKQETAAPDTAKKATHVVTDMAGRKVEIPEKINTVYCAVPTAEPMVYSLAPEKLAAWVNAPSDSAKKYLNDRVKNLPVLGGWMGEKCTANLEEIAKLAPDLIIFMTTTGVNNNPNQIADSITQQTKRPVVIMDSKLADTAKVYRIMGDILGVKDRAEKLASYSEKKMNEISGIVSKIPQDKLPKVYYAEGNGGLTTDPSGSDHTEVLDFVKGKNAADIQGKGGTGMAPVSMEQVLSWNPDVILVSSSSGGDQIYDKILKDTSWSKINAAKNGKVYITPLLPFGWYDRPPNIMRVLGNEWLASVLYPEYVKLDLKQDVKEFFSLFLDQKLTDDQVTELLTHAVLK